MTGSAILDGLHRRGVRPRGVALGNTREAA
jgi:hypothetical protein